MKVSTLDPECVLCPCTLWDMAVDTRGQKIWSVRFDAGIDLSTRAWTIDELSRPIELSIRCPSSHGQEGDSSGGVHGSRQSMDNGQNTCLLWETVHGSGDEIVLSTHGWPSVISSRPIFAVHECPPPCPIMCMDIGQILDQGWILSDHHHRW